MITTRSKNNSLMCVDDICREQIAICQQGIVQVEQQVHPLRRHLQSIWDGIRLFLGTDRWDRAVTLQRGDSHYTMKMEEIEARWRKQ